MKQKQLHKDIRASIKKSKGRFFSISALIALGCFALTGLYASGPDMRSSGADYLQAHNSADLTVIADMGLDKADETVINKTLSDGDVVEYGYMKDVVKDGSDTSIRVYSAPDSLSTYELVSGRMPEKPGEIAVASFMEEHPGDTLSIEEKEDISGNKVLKDDAYKVVGTVNSSELLSPVNLGESTAGTGELQGYAVVVPSEFDSDVHMMARLKYADTANKNMFDSNVEKTVQAHKEDLEAALANEPEHRLAAIKADMDEEIQKAQDKIDDGQKELDDKKQELQDGKKKLDDSKAQLQQAKDELALTQSEKGAELQSAQTELTAAKAQLDEGRQTIAASQSQLDQAKAQLDTAQKQIADGSGQLEQAKAQLDQNEAQIAAGKAQLQAARTELDQKEAQFDKVKALLPADQKAAMQSQLDQAETEYAQKAGQLAQAESQLNAGKAEYEAKTQELETAKAQYEVGKTEYQSKLAQFEQGKQTLANGQSEYDRNEAAFASAKSQLATGVAEAKNQIASAENQIADGEATYKSGLAEYNKEAPKAEKELADARSDVADAKQKEASLEAPAYNVYTRSEIPGGKGYMIYETVADIVDDLSLVFPVILYFIAALVTLTTMTRFVDEERTNNGTLSALGYEDKDILKKFVYYGLAASLVGAVVGIVSGQLLIPFIVETAYGPNFTTPDLNLAFYPLVSLAALAIGVAVAVIPAYIVTKRQLQEKPAQLLQAKAPANGSKILLEHVKPVWNRMSFTHKVTARNIFRYKKRMFMTIFGVCGGACLLFAGLSVQNSISRVNDRQFGDIIRYDMIVARNAGLTDDEEKDLDSLMADSAISQTLDVHYDTMHVTAGKKDSRQDITMIVPEGNMEDYITLYDADTKSPMDLKGIVISQKLADITHTGIGDTLTVQDSLGKSHDLPVSGISEMYTGHFIFMDPAAYEDVFGTAPSSNGVLVNLVDSSETNAMAARFMALDGVKGVVQNTTMISQIDIIVKALDMVMDVLVLVAALLAIVILYNLTNINVSERIRELSTIKVLGFYDKEVTLYIFRETMLLSLLGVLAGYIFGYALYVYILNVVPPAEVLFDPLLTVKAFLVPLLLVAVIVLVLYFVMNRRLTKVDMLEALKSVD